jgi:hypothetical protein
MTTSQWHPAKADPDWKPKVSKVKEFGLRVVDSQYGIVIQQFVRTREGFSEENAWNFSDGLMSESELQDMITSFTKRFVEDLTISQGVKLVLPR